MTIRLIQGICFSCLLRWWTITPLLSQPKMARLFCFFTLGIWEIGVGASIPVKSRTSLVGYFDSLSTWLRGWNRADLSAHRRHWSSFSHWPPPSWPPAMEAGGDMSPAQRLVLGDVQPQSLHSIDHPPRTPQSIFRAASGGGGWLSRAC